MINRKHLVLPIVLIVAILALIPTITHLAPPVAQTAIAAPVAVQKPDVYSLWQLTNQDRLSAGLQPLVYDKNLQGSATAKCNDMVRLNQWTHNLRDGTTPRTFMDNATANTDITWGENLAFGFNTAQKTETAWLNSPEHKANIMNPAFNHIGFAVCGTTQYPNMIVAHFTQQ